MNTMEFDCFSSYRDRQITKKMITYKKLDNSIQVLKSKNISKDGDKIYSIDKYDEFIPENIAKKLKIYKYFNDKSIYITPNMTYYPRVIENPCNVLFNGSIVILIPKTNKIITKCQLKYFSTEEFRFFYSIARNCQKRGLNIDNKNVYWFGLKK